MGVTIYHNPKCSKSRAALALLRDRGLEPTVVEYLKAPPGRAKLAELVARMPGSVRDLLRKRGTPYDELGLGDASLSDDALLDAMAAHPVLMERPLVESDKGVRLGRPTESILEIL